MSSAKFHGMRLVFLVLLLSAVAAVADDRAKPAADPPKKRQLTAAELRAFYTDADGRIVTEWTDMEEDTKLFRIFTKAGYATVLTEGKMQDGQMVFRKGYKHVNDTYPDAAKLMWYTYNGIDEEFFSEQIRRLDLGKVWSEFEKWKIRIKK